MLLVFTHITYLVLSIAVALFVGRTLHKNGRVFLVEALQGNEELADSVNHLLVVGFYLVNIGFVAVAIRMGLEPASFAAALELTSVKVGTVLLVLGGMHFFNLYVLARIRRRGQLQHAPPPVQPNAYWKAPPAPWTQG
jgi:hypothetical protein